MVIRTIWLSSLFASECNGMLPIVYMLRTTLKLKSLTENNIISGF